MHTVQILEIYQMLKPVQNSIWILNSCLTNLAVQIKSSLLFRNNLIKITIEKNEHYLKEKEHIYIPKNTIHRIENIGKEELIFIEIQLGENLKEEDIIRLEDDYGRV